MKRYLKFDGKIATGLSQIILVELGRFGYMLGPVGKTLVSRKLVPRINHSWKFLSSNFNI